jgi:hypothetical protein
MFFFKFIIILQEKLSALETVLQEKAERRRAATLDRSVIE